MRTPGACGGVKWGQTSLSLRLGIKGILRTAVEQESPGSSLSRQVRNHGGRNAIKVVAVVFLTHGNDVELRAKPRRETKNSCQCCSPPLESMLGVRSLKPKPNQTLLEISTDFASVTGPRNCFSELVTTNACLANHPKATRDIGGSPTPCLRLAGEDSRPGRICWKTGKLLPGWSCAARGV